jgi:hypothetical protein
MHVTHNLYDGDQQGRYLASLRCCVVCYGCRLAFPQEMSALVRLRAARYHNNGDDPLVTAGRQTFETRSNPGSWKGSQSRWDKAEIGTQGWRMGQFTIEYIGTEGGRERWLRMIFTTIVDLSNHPLLTSLSSRAATIYTLSTSTSKHL